MDNFKNKDHANESGDPKEKNIADMVFDLKMLNQRIQGADGITGLSEADFKSEHGKKRYNELKSIAGGKNVTYNKDELQAIGNELEGLVKKAEASKDEDDKKKDLKLINKRIQGSGGIAGLSEDDFKSSYAKKRFNELKSISDGKNITFNKDELEILGRELEGSLSGKETKKEEDVSAVAENENTKTNKDNDAALAADKAREDAKNRALEKVKQKMAVVNIDELAEAEARKAADAYMTESKASLKGAKGLLKKIWKHTFFDEYYRQREVNRVRDEIKNSGNIYSGRIKDGNKDAHENAMHGISERFASEYEGTLSKGEEKKALDAQDPESAKATADVKTLINEYAKGTLGKEAFENEKTRILNTLKDKDILKGSGIFADNLFEIAQNARLAIEHGAKLEELDLDTNIIIGKAKSSLKTEAHFNTIDKVVDKMKKSKIGRFISPAVLSTSVGLAYSISIGVGSRFLRSKAAAYGTFGASVAISSVFAGMNESQRLAAERAQHGIEMAEGASFEEDSKRREQMEKFSYKMESSSELAENLRGLMFEKDAQGNDIAKDIKQEDLEKILASLSDIEARNSLNSKNKIDLISYSNIGNVEKERTDLTILTARAKVELRKKMGEGLTTAALQGKTFDQYLAEQTKTFEDSLLGGEKGITAQDKAFSKFKTKEVAKKVLKTVVSGLVIGAVAQEGIALFKDNVEGVFEGMMGTGGAGITTQTPLENLREWMMDNTTHIAANPIDFNVGGHEFNIPDGTSILENSDGTYNILKGNTIVSDHIQLNFDSSGSLDAESISRLGEDGIIANTTCHMVDTTQSVTENAEGYLNNHSGTTHIARDGWYDNDTPKPIFDQNELKLQMGGVSGTGIDANGNYVLDIHHMASDGSFHEQFSVDAQEKMKSGLLKMAFSLTQGTQHNVFEVPIDVNGNAVIDPNSEIGKLFFGTENGHSVFKGRFAEVVESFGSKDGVEHVKSLATLVGPGNDSIPDIIPSQVEVPVAALDFPVGTQPPMFLPLIARKPLEPVTYKDFNEKGPGYYGYGAESGSFGLLDRSQYKERLCTELKENSEYDLSGNDSKIIKEYLSKQDAAYVKELETLVSANPKMSKDIETVITVPSYQEGKNIEKTIRNYSKLKNYKNFELVIFENHPSDKGRDETGDVIERMKKEFPDMNIIHLYKAFDKKPTIGEVRKYLVDSVMLRKQNSSIDKSIAVVSNDADLEDISENYTDDIAKSFKENNKLDAVGGKWDYPAKDFEQLPILHATQRLWHYFDIIFRNDYLKSPELIGRNSAFRSGVYAAVGGYNKDAKLAEDLEIGWMIKDARKHDSSRITYLNKASLVSNSRRAVAKMLSGGHLIEQYGDFHENEDVRSKSLDELLKDKKDFDPEIFKKEVQSIYNHYARWKHSNNGWIEDHFVDQTFDRAMKFTGVEYKKVGDSIEVVSIDKLIKGLNGEKNVKSDDAESISETVVETKRTKEMVSSDSIKDIIKNKLGSRAKIEKLDLNFNGDRLEIDSELNAGLIGGKIKIKGYLENSGDNLEINKDLTIDARGPVKALINNNLSNLAPEMKKYFEDKYKQDIKSINIENGQIALNFN